MEAKIVLQGCKKVGEHGGLHGITIYCSLDIKLWKFDEYFYFVANERTWWCIPWWNLSFFNGPLIYRASSGVYLPASAFLEQCQDTDYATNLKLTGDGEQRFSVSKIGAAYSAFNNSYDILLRARLHLPRAHC